ALFHLRDPQWHVEGEGVAGAGAVAVGRDDQDFVAGIAQTVGEDPDARRIHAVIVADQYPHAVFRAAPCDEPGHMIADAHPRLAADRGTLRPWAAGATRAMTDRTTAPCSARPSAPSAGFPRRRSHRKSRARPRAPGWRSWMRGRPAASSKGCWNQAPWRRATACATAATGSARACSGAWAAAITPLRTNWTCPTPTCDRRKRRCADRT